MDEAVKADAKEKAEQKVEFPFGLSCDTSRPSMPVGFYRPLPCWQHPTLTEIFKNLQRSQRCL